MNKRKILKNIAWLFFDKVVRIFGGLFIGIWVARYLGPKDFGILNYALAYTALFVLFVKLGLDQIVVREITKKVQLTDYYLGTAFWLKLSGSILAITAIFISLLFIEADLLTKIIIFIISISFVFQATDVIDMFFQSKVLSKNVVIARNSAFILSSLLQVYLIINEFAVIYFAIAKTIEFVMASGLLILRYKKYGNRIIDWKFSSNIAHRLLRLCWPLALTSFIITVFAKIDQVMIGNILNTTQVGIYSVAVILSAAWLFIPSILVNTLMPYFVNLKSNDKQLYHQRLVQLYSLMFWLGCAAGITAIVLGKWGIELLYGGAYIDAYDALVYNIWNGIFISQAQVRGIWMINENFQIYRLYSSLFAVSLNILANLLLIPAYGITGAAIATLLTQGLGTWVLPFIWKPMRPSNVAMIKAINPVYIYNYKKGGS